MTMTRATMVAAAACLAPRAAASGLEASKARPVEKVLAVLHDMHAQLEKEASEDKEVFDKVMCWCETNEKEKTKTIADAEAHITDLTSKIEEYTALSAKLAAEIKATEKEVSENQAALDAATEMRQKQLSDFNAEESDVTESVSALKAALSVLGKHNSFLQVSESHGALKKQASMQQFRLSFASKLQHAMNKQSAALSPKQREVVASFLQAPSDFESYAPQSGQIYGVLDQMRETFEKNLAASQKEENENQKSYDDLRQSKNDEIAAGQAQIDTKTQELADTDEKNANAKVDRDDTTAALTADEEFMVMLKQKCSQTDKEFADRNQARASETEACSKAIEILDSGRDLFTKTFNAALVQKSATAHSERRKQASKLLTSLAEKVHSPRLAALAVSVKLDAFTKVKQAIDDMVNALLQEKADEIKKKDFCVDEFNTNKLQTEQKDREKADLSAKIEDLNDHIKSLTEELDTLHTEVNELSVQMKRASEDREKENKDFSLIVSDQRATQQLLKAALNVLSDEYSEKAASLSQQPAGFDTYKKNSSSGGVLEMLQQIIADARAAEEAAIRDEADAQTAYEAFVKETNRSINTKNKHILNKSDEKANAEQSLAEHQAAKDGVVQDLDTLATAKAALHASCDFLMKNFEVRQTARDEEVQALRQAKAILSGAKFIQFLKDA